MTRDHHKGWSRMLHCKKDPIYVFPEMKLRGLVPNFAIHVSVSDLYISTIGPPICGNKIWGPILGIYKSLTDTWMWKLGIRPRSFISGNICSNFRYSVFAVCLYIKVCDIIRREAKTETIEGNHFLICTIMSFTKFLEPGLRQEDFLCPEIASEMCVCTVCLQVSETKNDEF